MGGAGGDNVRAVSFCAGDEAAGWSSRDWAFKAGLKNFGDEEGSNLFLFGMPGASPFTPECSRG